MDTPINSKRTIEIIERMKLAKIGKYKKWQLIIKKIKNDQILNPEELKYYSNLIRFNKNLSVQVEVKFIIQNYH